MKERRSRPRVQDDDPEDQGSKQAAAKMEAKKSKRALTRMRQKQYRRRRGAGICKIGRGCPGTACGIKAPPGLPAKGPDARSARGPGNLGKESASVRDSRTPSRGPGEVLAKRRSDPKAGKGEKKRG